MSCVVKLLVPLFALAPVDLAALRLLNEPNEGKDDATLPPGLPALP